MQTLPHRRHLPSLLALGLCGLALACRPAQKDMDEIKASLAQIQADQAALADRIENAEHRDEQAEAQRAVLVEGLTDIAKRLASVELRHSKEDEEKAARDRPRPGRPDPAAVYKVELGDSPTKGPDDALVTIVMWTDFQCPYCGRVQATLDQVEEKYGGDVRFVHKNNPLGFHPRAMPAALAAAAAAEQGKFWKMHDRLFANQKELTEKNFRKWAKKIRLDLERFDRDRESSRLKQQVQQEQADGVKLGARGTPAFFINGRFLSGAQPLSAFSALIDQELAKAKKLVRKGVPKAEVYARTIAEGKTSA